MPLNLSISIDQADNCKSFVVTEDTEVYNATTNTGGWGSPNPATTDVDEARILITAYGSATTYTVDEYPTLPNTAETTVTLSNTDMGLASTAKIGDGIYQVRYEIEGGLSITAVNTGTKTFTVSGDKSSTFAVGDTFSITGSSANDGTYTVTVITYGAPNTTITVSEVVPSAIVDGEIRFEAAYSMYEIFWCTGEACLHDKLDLITIGGCRDCTDGKILLAAKIAAILQAAKYAASCGKANRASALLTYLSDLCDLTSCESCD